MKVFVGEYVCGGGFADTPVSELPISLLAEGRAMLLALCEDASKCGSVYTIVDGRLNPQLPNAINAVPFVDGVPLASQWSDVAQRADKQIVIAPETEGILSTISLRLRDHCNGMIGCSDAFLHVASDKLLFASLMSQAGIPHPHTISLTEVDSNWKASHGWLIKPKDGCGSSDIYRVSSLTEIQAIDNIDIDNIICQPFINGTSISISAVVGSDGIEWLPSSHQRLDPLTLRYLGGLAPISLSTHDRAKRLARAALEALPGEAIGYVGVDLILGNQEDDDVVIEVNPRLTTSYVGLRHLMKSNIAAKMLSLDETPLQQSDDVREIAWTAEGTVTTIE